MEIIDCTPGMRLFMLILKQVNHTRYTSTIMMQILMTEQRLGLTNLRL